MTRLFWGLLHLLPESCHRSLRLIQQEFADVAIGPAITAFLETNAFAENAKESESHGDANEAVPEPPAPAQEVQLQPVTIPPIAPFPLTQTAASGDLNQINMDIRGDQVLISGLLDAKGLGILEKKIVALKLLLAVYTDANDTGDADKTSH